MFEMAGSFLFSVLFFLVSGCAGGGFSGACARAGPAEATHATMTSREVLDNVIS
jgi:hypothetical protein